MSQESSPPSNQLPDPILDKLKNFQVISSFWLRNTVAFAPAMIIVFLLADWLIGKAVFARDAFRLSSVILVIIELWVLMMLFRMLPEALGLTWMRNLLVCSSDAAENQQGFLRVLTRLEVTLNSRWAELIGLTAVLIGLSGTYPLRFLVLARYPPQGFEHLGAWWDYYFPGRMAILAVPLGYLIGVLVWRVVVIALFVNRLGRKFTINVQPSHPDQCGGLKPIGNLCLMIAMLLLVPAVYLSVWGFAGLIFGDRAFFYDQLWSGLFRQLLVVLSISATAVFIQPLYSIHLQMQEHRYQILIQLNELAEKIEQLQQELRFQANTIPVSEGEEKLKTLEFMRKVYAENANIPTWPLNWSTIYKFASAQIIPILGLLGTSEPVVKLVQSILGSLK